MKPGLRKYKTSEYTDAMTIRAGKLREFRGNLCKFERDESFRLAYDEALSSMEAITSETLKSIEPIAYNIDSDAEAPPVGIEDAIKIIEDLARNIDSGAVTHITPIKTQTPYVIQNFTTLTVLPSTTAKGYLRRAGVNTECPLDDALRRDWGNISEDLWVALADGTKEIFELK